MPYWEKFHKISILTEHALLAQWQSSGIVNRRCQFDSDKGLRIYKYLNMRKHSRLEEISRRKSLHKTILIIGGIIALIVIFFFYSVPLLINLSILADKLRGNKDTEFSVTASSYIAPPLLDPIKDATNSAHITISGSSLPNQVIKLYVNGKYIDKSAASDNKMFIFKNILLDPGDNDIKAKAVISNKESGYSEIIRIKYISKAPTLDISSPQDNQTISNGDGQVKVEGKTDPGVRVIINGYWAIVDTDGKFSYLLRLQKGDNTITADANDEAGNKTEKQIKVKLE